MLVYTCAHTSIVNLIVMYSVHGCVHYRMAYILMHNKHIMYRTLATSVMHVANNERVGKNTHTLTYKCIVFNLNVVVNVCTGH